MQHLLSLRCLWQVRQALAGGFAHSEFSKISSGGANAGRSLELGDRRGILSVDGSGFGAIVLPLLASFARFTQGIRISAWHPIAGDTMAQYSIAGYQLGMERADNLAGV
ncbi:MAG: hypothetical protein HY785_09195 [Oscillatoriophycideae cyanobacterium NC_groundwater_1537_Pr4_S-0.65um_50_18]|nr:hypothetical protein [Oscillatoriophycideae cyanobacterium NC_groundwater_1537_Pr4_S-0.65um_50_18]